MVSILDINEDDILDNIDVVAWAAKREEWDGHCTEAEAVAAIKADAEWNIMVDMLDVNHDGQLTEADVVLWRNLNFTSLP